MLAARGLCTIRSPQFELHGVLTISQPRFAVRLGERSAICRTTASVAATDIGSRRLVGALLTARRCLLGVLCMSLAHSSSMKW